jgi:hypothetical protein
VEPAAGNEGSLAHAVAGAITVVVAWRRLQHLVSLRSLLGSERLSPIEKSHKWARATVKTSLKLPTRRPEAADESAMPPIKGTAWGHSGVKTT